MKKIAGSLITLFLLLAVLSTPLFAGGDGSPCDVTKTLVAGQNWGAGEVQVSDDGVNLYVTFVAAEPWSLGETHLYVGWGVPKKAPGQFPYKGQTSYTIPLLELGAQPGDVLVIAAHAVVQRGTQQETAWGQGDKFGKSWAMYFRYTVCDGPSVSEE